MEEFKPDSDFRPDSSDRRPSRGARSSYGSSLFSKRSFFLSRQHLMIGLGVLILLLLIIGIGSALKGPPKSPGSGSNNAAREISLGEMSQSTHPGAATPEASVPGSPSQPAEEVKDLPVPPPVATTPTEAAEVPHTVERRVELAGNFSNALTQEQGPVDQVVRDAEGGLPTGPATLSGKVEKPKSVKEKSVAKEKATNEKTSTVKHEKSIGKPEQPEKKIAKVEKRREQSNQGQQLPAGHYTLQLSGASRSDTLNAFARKNNLSQYHVYETRRDGKPWYVLISGSYASSAEAKKAIATLPTEVKALHPWAKPMKQVRNELQQR